MREISTEGLVPLTKEGFGPWRAGDDLLLRTAVAQQPITTPEGAGAVYGAYAAARDAGVAAPAPVEVVRVDGGYGVLVEYVSGVGLGTHIMLGGYSLSEAGAEMGAAMRRMHAASARAGRDWNEAFRALAHNTAPLLSAADGARLAALVDAVPRRDAFLHGDVHVGNFVVHDSRIAVIDFESAGRGHPAFDLAIMWSRMETSALKQAEMRGIDPVLALASAREIRDAILRAYFDGAGAAELAAIVPRIEALSWVERAGRLGPAERGAQTPHVESLYTSAQARLTELLGQVDRLDFDSKDWFP